jgi:Ca2+-binding RTX toxin-like protein
MTEPNNTFNDATFVPDIYLEQNFFTIDSVSSGDEDYFKFYTLFGPSTLYAPLYGLSADADIFLYDQNFNLIASSTAGGNTSEIINASLQGNQYYYIKVISYTGAFTNYNLNLYNDYSGSTLETARNIGTSWGQDSSQYRAYDKIFWNDYLDFRDNVDIVKFQMEAPGTISLRRLSPSNNGGPALVSTMQLLDSSGNVLANGTGNDGSLNLDRYSTTAGTYYVRFNQSSGSGDFQFRITADYAGDTTNTARELGILSGTSRQLYDMVGSPFLPTYEDANDLYRFTLDKTSPVDLRLTIPPTFTSPTFDANLRLAQDTNGNGFIESGEVFLSSSAPGDDQLSATLGAGTYYAQVVQNGAYTSYQLDLDSDFDAVPGDPQAYTNMSQARSFGALRGETPFNFEDGFGISAGDFSDFFRFQMTASGRLSASAYLNSYFSRTTDNPSLSIVRDLNNNQRLDTGETITPFSSATLSTNLAAGTYYLHATGNGQQAAYYLRMVSDYAGNTLGTARPLASISGATPPNQVFQDYIEQSFDASSDVNDFYRFDLPSSYQVTLSTTGVSGEDLSLSLIRDANSNNVIDAGDVLVTSNILNSPTESLTRALTAGRYFARVQGINGSTNYTLTTRFGRGLVVTGNAGNNLINGDFLNDSLDGGSGNDVIDGRDGNDTQLGSTGNDSLWGGNGNDSLLGGDGNDTVRGTFGDDTVIGGNGNDLLVGGSGNDRVTSSSTNDVDIFRFEGVPEVQDIFTDFDRVNSAAVVGTDQDIIQLRNLGFNPTGSASDLPNGILPANRLVNGTASLGALSGFRYFAATGQLFFDSNGGNQVGSVLVATLSSLPSFASMAGSITVN